MQRRRVAFIVPSLAGGGAEKVMISVATGLDSARYDATLVALSAQGPLRDLVPKMLALVDLGQPRLRNALPALFSLFRRHRFDAIVSTMGYLNMGILLGGRIGSGGADIIVREANTPDATLASLRLPGLGRFGYRHLYRRAGAVVCNAHGVRRELAALGVPAKHIRVIPNPVDIDAVRSTTAMRDPGPGRRFVAVGRLTHQKGFDRLVSLMRQTPPDDRLTILGEGPLRADLEKAVRDAGLSGRIGLPGFSNDPLPLIAGADAFLMPSRWEGLPNAALEALALGTPVIASAQSGGLADLSDETSPGALTIADTAERFASAVRNIHARPEPTGLRPNALPARFSRDAVVASYADLIDAGADKREKR